MDINLAYIKLQMKVNENFGNSKMSIDKGRASLVLNESMNKVIELILDKKEDDELRYLQKILVKNKSIKRSKTEKNTDSFELPTNYFDFSSAYTLASNKICSSQHIDLFEIKDDNSTSVLGDINNSPSFEYRETPFTFSEDKLVVFNKDFENTTLILSYYRYPKQIKLVDPENPESDFTKDSEIEFDDKLADRIITMAASEFKLNNNDASYQVNKQQVISKI